MRHIELTDELRDDDSGRQTRPLAARQWAIPAHVELQGERLLWSDEPSRVGRVGPHLLEGFVSLADAPPERILSYATRWGVLELCEHNMPPSHQTLQGGLCAPRETRDGRFFEPVAAWRWWANRAKATLTIAAQLHHGAIAPTTEWEAAIALESRPHPPGYQRHSRVEKAWRELAFYLNHWLRVGRVRPLVELVEAREGRAYRPAILLGVGGLFGALAIHLVLAVSRTNGLALCSNCGAGYSPFRQPRTGERHYCEDCRKGKVPQRDAARDFWKRKRRREPRGGGTLSRKQPVKRARVR